MTAGGKALDVAHDGAQRSAGQCTDAGDLTQLLDAHIGAGEGIELALDAEDTLQAELHWYEATGIGKRKMKIKAFI